jgi:hypothetical protein
MLSYFNASFHVLSVSTMGESTSKSGEVIAQEVISVQALYAPPSPYLSVLQADKRADTRRAIMRVILRVVMIILSASKRLCVYVLYNITY